MTPFLSALVLAASLSFGVGPGLILQFDAAVNRGFKGGVLVVLGIHGSDLIIMSLSGLGISQLLQSSDKQLMIGIFGGIILCGMGLKLLTKKSEAAKVRSSAEPLVQAKEFLPLFLKGALVNLTNPSIIFYWLTITGMSIGAYGYLTNDYYLFFVTLFGASCALDLIKVWMISRYRTLLGIRQLGMINRFMGAALLCIGIFFCVRAVSFR